MTELLVIPNEREEARVFKEYGMTEEQVKTDVAAIRQWMLLQPYLPEFPDSKNGNYTHGDYIIWIMLI